MQNTKGFTLGSLSWRCYESLFARAFLLKLLLELEVINSGSFKLCSPETLKRNHQKDASHLKNNKKSSHGKRYKKHNERRDEKRKL